MSMKNAIFISFITILFSGCATGKLILNVTGDVVQRPPNEIPSYTIYALGDAGEDNEQFRAVMDTLKVVTNDDVQPGTIIFLGDNIYPAGMPSEAAPKKNQKAKSILMQQVDAVSKYRGKVVFIPGNHDWNEFKAGGLEAIRREAKFIDEVDPAHISFLPQNGCSGPNVLELNDQVVLLIIDSQWWIQDWSKEPEMNAGCDNDSKAAFIKAFQDKVSFYKDRQILVAMHHPLYTQGPHGGHFTIKNHLFPLTAIADWMYLPLPVIGSIYPFYRSIFGHSQDLKNPRYRSLRDELLKDLDYDGNLIFLSGHEHCLQYISKGKNQYLVSGSGSKQTPIANDEDLIYGHKSSGFMELDFYKNNTIWLTIYEVNPKTKTSGIVFSREIIQKSVN
ncbi:MAG TPA: metallophosphoesterase [Saprospiraceae bacterium]|nr:metallophosphoesterase [Saprospiraceae bacterium]